jgi:DNA-binding MarR family transcriptional regulator
MTPEQIARTHQFREGFELVDYGEVGLPIFRLTLEAITLAQRRLPTVQEFAMRCVSIGISSLSDVARTLGLKMDIVEVSAGALIDSGYAAYAPSTDDGPALRLTEAGEARLKNEIEEVPQDETLVIDYDAIQRVPIRLAAETVLRASDLKGIGAIELRPYPADAPPIAELSIPEIVKVIRRQSGDEFRRTVLALKRIGRRSNLFREAVALVYAAPKSDEIQIAFVVGGKPSEPLERAYARNGGPKKMGFVKAVATASNSKVLERLVGKDALKSVPSKDVIDEVRREEAEALSEVAEIEPAMKVLPARASRSAQATAALDAAMQRVALAKHTLNSFSIRPLACYEQDEILDEVLRKTKRSLFITSAGLQGSSLNGFRLREIDKLIEQHVDIQFKTYLTPSITPRGNQRYDPLVELTKRSERGGIRFGMMSQSDFFFLISDEELAVISNRPFFGEVTRRNSFLRVNGLVIRERGLIAHLRQLADGDAFKRGKSV